MKIIPKSGKTTVRTKEESMSLLRFTKGLKGNETGVTLVEVLISLAVLSLIAVAFISSLATAAKATSIADERATAESLARSQMEYVKNLPYSVSYSKSTEVLGEYEHYDVDIVTTALEDGNMQKIKVAVHHQDKLEVIVLEDYKVNR